MLLSSEYDVASIRCGRSCFCMLIMVSDSLRVNAYSVAFCWEYVTDSSACTPDIAPCN